MSKNKVQTKTASKDEHMESPEAELQSFYNYCKENGLTDEEIHTICRPLSKVVKRHTCIYYGKISIILAAIALAVYGLSYVEFVTWNITAIGRIIMIKLLPFWDWTTLRKEKCLIPNFVWSESKVEESPFFDCVLCESLDTIPMESNINAAYINEHYLNLHHPVLVTDALRNWPTSDAHFNLTEEILLNPVISNSYPCLQMTNVLPSSSSVERIITAVGKFQKHFVHFLNCDFNVVKEFRLFAPRPYFLPAEISPVQYSWVLISKDYDFPKLKRVELREKTAVFAQISGSNFVRLTAREPCEMECAFLQTEIQAGEALVITNLWNLEYKPNPSNKNVAMVLEFN